MRSFFVVVLALFAAPALAQDWGHYDNGRFAYGVDIPPGFAATGESDNGDGRSFYDPDGAKGLLVWGGSLVDDFESTAAQALNYASAENGFNVTYQAVTPRWASFSGVKGSRVVYQRMVLLCDGDSYAAFRADYSVESLTEMDGVIGRLVQSLKGAC